MQQTIKEQEDHHQLMMTMMILGGGDGMPLYAQLGFPSQEAYMAAMRLATQPPAGLPAAVQPMQTMDLNRIAYRFMADGGFLDDEDR